LPETIDVSYEPPDAGAISLDQLVALNDEIAALVRAGVPLERGLLDVVGDLPGRLGTIARALGARMGRGESLTQALEAEGDTIPPTYRAVVEAGIRSGRLTAALEGLAQYARGYLEMRRVIGLALLYPLIVLAMAYALLLIFVLKVAPRFVAAFESLHLPVQGALVALSKMGDTVYYWGWIVPALLIGLAFAWWLSGLASRFGAGLGGPIARVPWMRSMLASARASGFAELLALLLEHRVPLPAAIELAGDATGDPALRNDAHRVAASVRRGEPLGEVLRGSGAIPPLLRWLMATGESQGSLAAALHHAATSYRHRALHQADLARVFLPTILLFVIGATATLIYGLSLFLPLSAMLRELAID
jgi:general secretion pathway protein F